MGSPIVVVILRRGLKADWALHSPILVEKEIAWETDTLNWKVGDGKTPWNNLVYQPLPLPEPFREFRLQRTFK